MERGCAHARDLLRWCTGSRKGHRCTAEQQRDAAGALAEFEAVLAKEQAVAAKDLSDAVAQAVPAYSNEEVDDALLTPRNVGGPSDIAGDARCRCGEGP